MARVERMAAEVPAPVYAIDDQTTIKVVGGSRSYLRRPLEAVYALRGGKGLAMTTTETSAPMAAPNHRVAIETLLALSARAYEGDPTHSLLANLRAVRDAHWTVAPPGGGRAIADIVEHVGWSKWMYRDRAFGAGTLRGDAPPIIPAGGARSRPMPELLAWLDDGHRQWIAAIRSLSDDAGLQRGQASSDTLARRSESGGAWAGTADYGR